MRWPIAIIWRWHRDRGPLILARSRWFRIEHHPEAPAGLEVQVVFTVPVDRPLPAMSAGDADELGGALRSAGRWVLTRRSR